eukprot:CAMPEP_0113288082 /NCGR_PEP_ID=MMETSP0008_2-20120614/32083_1 /TAXON_ID=97485 /ORGANISM="Prymnesium parvum" /LENGTH=815 /DNA_ID=CAMNT_0000139419 /DNA_START=165 /DNA_END=2614 /DNA_ORIENTATION=- /assembly_acc=CAM_ASM_000153
MSMKFNSSTRADNAELGAPKRLTMTKGTWRTSFRGVDESARLPPPRDPNALTAAAAAWASPSIWCLDGTMTQGSANQDCRRPDDPERDAEDEALTKQIANNMEKYCNIVRKVTLFSEMGEAEIEAAAAALQVKLFKKGEIVYDEGDDGHDCWVIESGEVVASIMIPGIRFAGTKEWKQTIMYSPDRTPFFGERGLLRKEPRPARMTCMTDVKALRIVAETFVECSRIREHKENLIRGVQLFETFTDDQVGKIAAVIKRNHIKSGERIVVQGDPGPSVYLLVSDQAEPIKSGERIVVQGDPGPSVYLLEHGECSVSVNGTETHRLKPGQLIDQRALLEDGYIREATVVAIGDDVDVYELSRKDFEAKLGPLSVCAADGAVRGGPAEAHLRLLPAGRSPRACGDARRHPPAARPLHQDVMVRGVPPVLSRLDCEDAWQSGGGKGLNIKGKSAKKNRLSGFVPFLQIHDNNHKSAVEDSPKEARTKIFYRNVMAREIALTNLNKTLREARSDMKIDDPTISLIRTYEPVPEPLMKEQYIMRADISPFVGWETGRPSEPAFMDMNLHAVRGNSSPTVVVYQQDLADPMNPLGLLIAYAEAHVKPVCSDFDTFTVGSRGMKYDVLPPQQVELIHWALDHTAALLANPSTKGWTSRWLDVLKEENKRGFHPELPKYGFGDPTSYRLIEDVVAVTEVCGAVRHGAECFNFYFPQELDDEFLVIWEGFSNPPWQSFKEPALRQFLLERVKDGYSFPLNPVWSVRDPGWYEVLTALQANPEGSRNLKSWYPSESGVVEKIKSLHAAHPNGFQVLKKDEPPKPPA